MEMNDRELLELAAKALGGSIFGSGNLIVFQPRNLEDFASYWDPLTDDGDALRLAVALRITVGPESTDVIGQSLCRVSWNERTMSLGEYGRGDPMQATRRAIVRAAAHIGGGMP